MGRLKGSCHCGAVCFEIASDLAELTTCDCSLCVKKNALMVKVHESQFRLLSDEADIREYRWNTHIARHFFCATCGIYTFHRKQAAPDHYGVNVFCLDDIDPKDIPIRATEGANMDVVKTGARCLAGTQNRPLEAFIRLNPKAPIATGGKSPYIEQKTFRH